MDFHFHVFLECMYVRVAAQERPTGVREQQRGRVTETTRQSIPYIWQNDTQIKVDYAWSLVTWYRWSTSCFVSWTVAEPYLAFLFN